MGKYEPLKRYLESRSDDSWPAHLSDIEHVLGFALPASAYKYYAWWANETSGTHSHAKSWQEAGWNTRDVNLEDNFVRFERVGHPACAEAPAAPAHREPDLALGDLGQLVDLAGRILRITDHREIMRIALESLIRDAVNQELIGIGGSMPDLQLPERERPAAW
jgi:hypothetical protein